MSIRTRVIIGIVLIVAFLAGGTGLTFFSIRQQRIALDSVDAAADTVANQSIALIQTAKEIELDVVQVQQFLSDISATRARTAWTTASRRRSGSPKNSTMTSLRRQPSPRRCIGRT
jgi:flagellar basal body-associated protein FliL